MSKIGLHTGHETKGLELVTMTASGLWLLASGSLSKSLRSIIKLPVARRKEIKSFFHKIFSNAHAPFHMGVSFWINQKHPQGSLRCLFSSLLQIIIRVNDKIKSLYADDSFVFGYPTIKMRSYSQK